MMICSKCLKEYDELLNETCPYCSKLQKPNTISFDSSRRIRKVHARISKPISEYSSNSIEEMFPENCFAWFVRYCRQTGISTFVELEALDFSKLISLKGVGIGKVEAITAQYDSLCQKSNNNGTSDNIILPATDEAIYVNQQLYAISSAVLMLLGMKKATHGKLKKHFILSLKDLCSIPKTDYALLGIKEVLKYERVLAMDLSSFTEEVLKELSKDSNYEILTERVGGATLQEVAERVGLTRERVRQIVGSLLRKTTLVFENVVSYLQHDNMIIEDQIEEFFSKSNNAQLFEYWLTQYYSYQKNRFQSLYMPEKDAKEYVSTIDSFFDLYFDEESCFENLLNGLNEYLNEHDNKTILTGAEFEKYLEERNYYHVGREVYKTKPSYGYLCSKIIQQYFPNGFKLYDSESLAILRNHVLNEFGNVEMPNNDRAFSTAISRYTVLCGRGTVTAKENVHIDTQLLEEIKDYIDRHELPELYYADLFAAFEGKLKVLSNVDNYHFLHGVLKLCYPEDYTYSDRDYISKDTGRLNESGVFSKRLNEIIVKEARPLTKKEIKTIFPGMTSIRLATAVSSSDSLLVWNYDLYYSLDCIYYSENDLESIREAIIFLCKEKGYCGIGRLYDYISVNYPNVIDNTHISEPTNLYYLCSKLLASQFGFKKPNIFVDKGVENKEPFGLLTYLLGRPDEFSYQSLLRIGEEQKWSESTRARYYSLLEKELFRISEDIYLQPSEINLDDETKTKISETIENNMEEGVFSLISFNEWQLFPDIGLSWNAFLLKSLVDKHLGKFKTIEVLQRDRRYVRALIVFDTDPASSYSDLIYRTVVNEWGTGSFLEEELVTFLILRGMIYKSIPKELEEHPRVVKKNGIWAFK